MTNLIKLNQIGNVNLSRAEISDFDTKSKRLFVTGESEGKPILQVVDASDPTQPILVDEIDLSSLGGGIQSVAIRKGTGTENSIVAVAISAHNITDPGKVVFYDAVTLTKLSEVTVGALPDMITFTPDGSKLLVANEGEPSEDYSVDPEGSISIIDVSGNIANLNNNKVTTVDFKAFDGNEDALRAAGVRIFGLNASASQDFEPEYIAVSPDGTTAFITLQENNAIAILNIANATITDIVPLGFKNHNLPGNSLDASDRDGTINIQNWPIFGMYQPDGISSFQVNGQTYYITANEGDARIRPTDDNILPDPNDEEGDIFNEEDRVKDVTLDPTAFPNAAELQSDANLGRLLITNTLGDTDGDGDFDQLYAFGARSFSIWNNQGHLVYDSGDKIEQILAQLTPTLFNANNGSVDDFDTRSDNKGPEPESVVVGVINGIPYGFIGLERASGGVMVYDLSNPTAPEFIQYIRTDGDVSPEGLKFISAEDSPNAQPMLAVAHEVSNTVSFYEILTQPKLTKYQFENLPTLGTTINGDEILLGGFSGLYFVGVAENGNLKFITHPDRGPNGENSDAGRPFPLPDFQPEIVSFELNQTSGEITITDRIKLFRADGTTPLTGLPNLQAGDVNTAYTDEFGVDLQGHPLTNDPFGADLEGIVVAPNGDFWMVDEYRPAIYQFNSNGILINRFVPQGTATAVGESVETFGTEVLPEVYAQRRGNRGFEAVALEGNKLYAFIQSAIDNPDLTNDGTSRNSRNLRILEFDIVSRQVTGEYLYLLDNITGSGNARTDKIGDAVSLGNGKFAVIERDDISDETSNKLIYQINLADATNINNPANFTLPVDKTIEQLTEAELAVAGITPVSKHLIVNAAELGYTGVEKLEGLALVSPNTLAILNDNDFNIIGSDNNDDGSVTINFSPTPIPLQLGIIELPYNLVPEQEIFSVFSIAEASAVEGNFITFTITRTNDILAEQTVTVSTSIKTQDTASEDDFTPKTEILTFAVGETEKTFTVETAEDFRIEENETFTVNLSNATNGAAISSTNGTAKGTINDDDIPLAAITNNNIFTIKGVANTVRLKVTLIANSSSVVNELGVFIIDDAEGRIDGIAPGEQGYNEVALERARSQGKAVFSAIANLPNLFRTEIETNSLTRLLEFNSGSHLKFFLVEAGTIDNFRAGLISSTNIIFADDSAITQEDDGFTISLRETSTNIAQLNSFVVKIQSTDESLTTGTALQGENQAELIDLTSLDESDRIQADFSVYREAAFNNEVYFYKVDNAQGLIGTLEATAANRANYLQAAINNLIQDVDTGEIVRFAASNQGVFTDSAIISGGLMLAPMIIVNGTLSQLTDNNPANNPQVYFPYLGVNSDGVDHIRLLGDNIFGFEDLPGGGDLDYNDIIIRFNLSVL